MPKENIPDNAKEQFREHDRKGYLEERVTKGIGYYQKEAREAKRIYLTMRSVTVILGAIVPILININTPLSNAIATIFSTTVVILVALESVFHFRERWKNYRVAETMIIREKNYFLTRSGPYEKYYKGHDGSGGTIEEIPEGGAFHQFVRQIESIITSESTASLHTLTSLDQKTNTSEGEGL